MQIEYREGSALNPSALIVAHGVNLQGKMGKGIALSIREECPQVYKDYISAYKSVSLGDIVTTYTPKRLYISCFTQEFYGNNSSVRYCSYDAIRMCMRKINQQLEHHPVVSEVHMPMIGCGLANGDWSIVSKIIEEESTHFKPVVYKMGKV